jgi:hypothetical protein
MFIMPLPEETIDIAAHYEKRKHVWMKKIGNVTK